MPRKSALRYKNSSDSAASFFFLALAHLRAAGTTRGHGGLNLERGVGQSVEELPSAVHLESRSESEKKVVGRWSVPTFEPKSWEGPPEIWIEIWGQSNLKWSGKDWTLHHPCSTPC